MTGARVIAFRSFASRWRKTRKSTTRTLRANFPEKRVDFRASVFAKVMQTDWCGGDRWSPGGWWSSADRLQRWWLLSGGGRWFKEMGGRGRVSLSSYVCKQMLFIWPPLSKNADSTSNFYQNLPKISSVHRNLEGVKKKWPNKNLLTNLFPHPDQFLWPKKLKFVYFDRKKCGRKVEGGEKSLFL